MIYSWQRASSLIRLFQLFFCVFYLVFVFQTVSILFIFDNNIITIIYF